MCRTRVSRRCSPCPLPTQAPNPFPPQLSLLLCPSEGLRQRVPMLHEDQGRGVKAEDWDVLCAVIYHHFRRRQRLEQARALCPLPFISVPFSRRPSVADPFPWGLRPAPRAIDMMLRRPTGKLHVRGNGNPWDQHPLHMPKFPPLCPLASLKLRHSSDSSSCQISMPCAERFDALPLQANYTVQMRKPESWVAAGVRFFLRAGGVAPGGGHLCVNGGARPRHVR